MKEIVLATHNKHKVKEILPILKPFGLEVKYLKDFDQFPEPEETGETFLENSRQKALFFTQKIPHYILSDDSGLEVEYLKGSPGIYSKRFAGPEGDYDKNNLLLLEKLKDVPASLRRAQFRCALCLSFKGKVVIEVEGIVRGYLAKELRGSNGFGYDPLFIYPPLNKTFGELTEQDKNKISHRFLALRALSKSIKDYKVFS